MTLVQSQTGKSKLARSLLQKERRMVRAFFRDRLNAVTADDVHTSRVSVNAQSFRSIGYDMATHTLEVEFRSGIYQYQNVSLTCYQRFLSAFDKESFFKEEVGPHHYCQRIRRR